MYSILIDERRNEKSCPGCREANGVMLRAMTGVSEPFMEALLDGYAGGFDGVGTLVDVGGRRALT